MGKFPKQFSSLCIVDPPSILKGIISSKVYRLTEESNFGHPFIPMLVPRYTLESTGIVGFFSSVKFVLRTRAFPEIVPAVVEKIVIYMVGFLSCFTLQNEAMHVNSFPVLFSGCIKNRFGGIPSRPIPLIQPFIIDCIDQCTLAFGKRDDAIRCIRWLSNKMPLKSAFWHESSTKGFALLSHFTLQAHINEGLY